MTSALLPRNSTKWEKALADAMSPASVSISGINAMRRFKIMSPRPNMLPFLVWEYGLGELTPYVPNLYTLIDEGVRWQRLRGTVSAIAVGLAWIGYTADLEEAWSGRRFWNSFQLRFPELPANDDPDLERIEGITKLSVPLRSKLRRGVHQYDITPLEGDESQYDEAFYDFESGISVTQGGTIWSFGRTHEIDHQLTKIEGVAAGYWLEPDWYNPPTGSPLWTTLNDVLWADADFLWTTNQLELRERVMAGWFAGKPLYLRLEDENGFTIGFRRARASHRVSKAIDGEYEFAGERYGLNPDGRLLYVEAMTDFEDADGVEAKFASLIVDGGLTTGIAPGQLWLPRLGLEDGVPLARTAISAPLRKTVRERFKFLLRFDLEPPQPDALQALGSEYNGLSISFTDNSYASRTASLAEIALLQGSDYAISFLDNSYAEKPD